MDDAAWAGLSVVDRIPVFATTAIAAKQIELAAPPDLTLDDQPSFSDVIAGYGGWMSDRALAELLVVPADLERVDRRFAVGRVDGRVIGCAFVWYAANTGYLSGIGVVPELRGRGYGRALTAAAALLAARNPDGSPTDAAWMYATDEGAALYERMGFERIDTEVSLSES
jgi:GNAT superfamily N-acetyltransferase